jgi:N-acetylmuramoyl-L-alanine amidase
MRLLGCLLLAVSMLSVPLTTGLAAAEPPVKLKLNSINLASEVSPYINSQGRTMVPIRLISETLKCEVQYVASDQQVQIKGQNLDMNLWIGQPAAQVNGREVQLDVPPEIAGGRTMVPLRFVAENMGADVKWENPSRTVYINASWVKPEEIVVISDQAQLTTSLDGETKDLPRGASLSLFYADQANDRFLVTAPDQSVGWISGSQVALAVRGFEPALPLAGKVIVLDPGHGNLIQPGNWSNPGAVGPGGTAERDVVMDIARQARDLLVAQGAKVILTRDGDTNLSLKGRVQVAAQADADLYVAIHNNSSASPNLNGMGTYYDTTSTQPYRKEQERLAEVLQAEMVQKTGLRDLGLIDGDYTVTSLNVVPAVLLEVGFISNPAEEKLLNDGGFRSKAAQGIAAGLERYFEEGQPVVAAR